MAASSRWKLWSPEEVEVLNDPDTDSFDVWEKLTGNPNKRSFEAWKQRRYALGFRALMRQHNERGRKQSYSLRSRRTEENEEIPGQQLALANEEIARLRAQLSDVKADRRRARESEAWADIVTAAVHDSIPRLPSVRSSDLVLPTPDTSNSEQELILVLSDLQIGSHVSSEETGGLASFSFEVYEQQVKLLEEAVASIKLRQLSHVPIKRLNVFGLGDFIDGDAIFEGHPWEVDRHLVDQITEGSQVLAKCLARLSGMFDEVVVKAIPGNHGRLGKKREAAPIGRNADLLFARFLDLQLQQHDKIRVDISPSWWMLVQRMNTRFLLVHGEDVRSWMSIPYYGFERAERRWFGLIQLHLPEDVVGAAFHWLVAGHHHTPACLSTTQGGKILLNGSWPGGSAFAAKALQASNAPSQWLLALHPERGVTSMWALDLSVEETDRKYVEIDSA